VAEDPDLRRVVARGGTTAGAARDHTVKVDVTGLRPATTYFYAFEARDRRSMVGRTRTAPARGTATDRLRFAVASCSKYDQGFFNAYARMAEADVDAVLHLGDYIYEEPNKEDAPGDRFIDPRGETYTLSDYRRRHAQYKLDPDLQRVHQSHPMVVTWDDHESANNAWIDGANRHDPQLHGPFSVRKSSRSGCTTSGCRSGCPRKGDRPRSTAPAVRRPGRPRRLDTRLEGRSQQLEGRRTTASCSRRTRGADPERQMYSPTQRAFVEQSLAGPRAAWKLVLNQVLVSQLKAQNLPDDVSRALASLGQTARRPRASTWPPTSGTGTRPSGSACWASCARARSTTSVVLTGDIHVSMANDLTEDPFRVDVPPAAVEFVTTSVTSSNFDEIFGSPPRTTSLAIERALQAQNPSTRYLELDSNGWTLLDVTRERVQAEYLFVETVAEPSDGQRLDATWQVRRGENRLVAGGPQTAERADRPPAAPQPRVIATGPGPSGAGAAGRNLPAPAPVSALPATGGAATGPLALAALGLAALLGRRTRRPLEEQP
jgi:alkaline phosphatase D